MSTFVWTLQATLKIMNFVILKEYPFQWTSSNSETAIRGLCLRFWGISFQHVSYC